MSRAAIELRILSLYTAGSETEAYNISEIARGTGAAYPHVHSAVKQMLEDGLLHEYQLGKSLFCRVDLSNDLARNLLAQAGLQHKEEALDNQETRNIDREVQRLAVDEPSIIAAIYKDDVVTLVVSHTKTSRRISRNTFIPNLSFTTPQKLKQELLTTTALLKNAVILFGYERLLHLINPIHEQLLLLHSHFGMNKRRHKKMEVEQ